MEQGDLAGVGDVVEHEVQHRQVEAPVGEWQVHAVVEREPRPARSPDVDDVDALSAAVLRLHDDDALRVSLRTSGRPLAESLADDRLDGRWGELLEGFVSHGG